MQKKEKNILITGAKSIIGQEVMRYLSRDYSHQIIEGGRQESSAEKHEYRYLDLNDVNTFSSALKNIDTVFLVFPRAIKSVKNTFITFLDVCKKEHVKEIIFCSIKKSNFSFFVPHNKVESLIKKSGLKYTIVAPSYFMQNLTTFFLDDIKSNQCVAIPGYSSKINWIDARNVGYVITKILHDMTNYENSTMELTGDENKDFMEVCAKLTAVLSRDIEIQPNTKLFIKSLKEKGLTSSEINKLLIFHFAESFSKSKTNINNNYEKIANKKPTRLHEFIMRHISDLSCSKSPQLTLI
ncbi:NmrA family NAD(P)-binding protein [Flammeovirga kamogawensis]|uniref:NmrA family NAD(P)-binding protein n=1 Tax=Flammeovirga kamogawensis TaxID=373891 RepID=A0ABX8GZL4_9BACT|nr:NmrA family NAD(P)-binding protein [Flammeovirga kamogawensis]MBB6459504.1 uncharacterized protein YbjT (DUF2867 family) [Flammeovirga kamogawensis]QWG09055.1 NmrA family NAD(P)-binding protein [Flammeovirga kamogawensis]TRX67344.1 hypothetical protein EO216_03995 [Flammeovirga kamogawensis]